MGRWIQSVIAAFSIFALAGTSPALDPAPQTPENLQLNLSTLIKRLASPEFTEREAAQKELEAILPSQADVLRRIANAQQDPEVKSRLADRVKEMDFFNTVHPPLLSLDIKNGSMAEVATILNAQFGTEFMQGVGRGIFTLHADRLPFWDIMNSLNQQNALTPANLFSQSDTLTPTMLRVISMTAVRPRTYKVEGPFAMYMEVFGSQLPGYCEIRFTVWSDPRIRVVELSSKLQVDSMTDQNGNSLLPARLDAPEPMWAPPKPVVAWQSSVTIDRPQSANRISKFRGQMKIAVLVGEKKLTIDLNHPPDKPIATSRGDISIQKVDNKSLIVQIDAHEVLAPRTLPVKSGIYSVDILLKDESGKSIRLTTEGSPSLTADLTPILKTMQPKTLELCWPESTHAMQVPVEFDNIELPGH